ncbi:phage integrase SAM-like domain-containing protein [Larkinella sp.]|uniref:phage integrase SAM-like domain-containing protein n=1 Tax=Larkinella sp. TaxID=2034517 RepID=UPI003BAB896E
MKANQDGTFPLAIRVTVDRKSSYIYLGQSLRESDWDALQQKVKKSHPNSTRLNNFILQKRAEANDKLLDMASQQKDVSSNVVRKQIKSKASSSFFSQADIFIENMRKQGKYNRVSAEQPYINHFRAFLDGRDITFAEISVSLLNKFKAYLKGVQRISERTVANHLILIRTIFNQAIADNLVDQKYYPFGKGKTGIKIPESVKIGLNAEEVKLLETLDLSASPTYWTHARNIWLISFYLAGARVSDVLRLKQADFQNDRLHYTMGKNAKTGSLKVSEKVLSIIEQYPKGGKHDLVFPDLQELDDFDNRFEVQRKISFAVKRLDRNLQEIARFAGINKKLTMHIARHTFGNLSGDKIPIQLLQKLYRHTSITTTIGYQGHFIHKDADDALDVVLGN